MPSLKQPSNHLHSGLVRELTHPQRDAGDTRYSNFVDQIGDGHLPESYSTATITGLIKLEVMAVTTDEDEAINFVFPNIDDVHECSQRAIITGTNRVVDALNTKILARLQGDEIPLFSVTRLCSDETRLTNLLSTEFLNSLKSPGVPEHELKLKLNCLHIQLPVSKSMLSQVNTHLVQCLALRRDGIAQPKWELASFDG